MAEQAIRENIPPPQAYADDDFEYQQDNRVQPPTAPPTAPAHPARDTSERKTPRRFLEKEEWKKDIKSLIRRAEIYKQINAGVSLKEIKDAVRAYENRIGVSELVDGLIEEEFNPDPKMERVTRRLSESLKQAFPEFEGIILLGSSIHGGAAIRRATNQEVEPDYDWGIITNKQIGDDRVSEMLTHALPRLTAYSRDEEMNDTFHSCVSVNPYAYRVTMITSDEAAITKLRGIANTSYSTRFTSERLKELMLFFQPSFPKEPNQRNREQLLNALQEMHRNNPSQWQNTIDNLLGEWMNMHRLKEKHFKTPEKRRDRAMVREIAYSSAWVMKEAMRAVLESTKR